MSKQLKAHNTETMEKAIAEAISKLTDIEYKCSILSLSYRNPEQATLRIELSPIPYEERLRLNHGDHEGPTQT